MITSAGALAASNGRIATLDERIAGAQKVVVASARSVDAGWRENTYGDRLIVSRVLLDVEETLKGTASNGPIWMELEGGTLDGVTLRVSDLPDLQPGERAVFFLDQGDNGFSMAKAVDHPHVDAALVLRKLRAVVVPARGGAVLDKAAAADTIVGSLAGFQRGKIALPVRADEPRVRATDLAPAKAQVRTALARPVRMSLVGM